jgi:hypothetical protein
MTLEDATKIATLVGGMLVGAGAIFQYADTADREIRRAYNERKLALCVDASDTAASLASTKPESATWARSKERFDTLYWGSLAMFEDQTVEDSMVSFRRMLSTIGSGEAGTLQLQRAALTVSRACRSLVSETWKLHLPVLAGKGADQ